MKIIAFNGSPRKEWAGSVAGGSCGWGIKFSYRPVSINGSYG